MSQRLFLLLDLLLLIGLCNPVRAQDPLPIDWVFVVDGYNTVSLQALVVDDEGNTYAGIDYGMTLNIPELALECPRAGHVSRLLLKLSPQGKALWARPMTSAYDGRIEAMALTPEGDVLVSGFCDGKSTYPSSGKDLVLGEDKEKPSSGQPQYLYICKYSPKGKLIWAKVYSQAWGQVGGLDVNSKGDIYWSFYHRGTLMDGEKVIDQIAGPANKEDRISVWKMDSEGNFVERLPIRYQKMSGVNPARLSIDSKDNLIIHGYYNRRITLSETDSLTNDPQYDSKDYFIAKYSPAHELLWKTSIGGRSSQGLYDLFIDARDNLLMAGEFDVECNFSNSVNPLHRSQAQWESASTLFIAEMDPSGKLLYVNYPEEVGWRNRNSLTALARDHQGTTHSIGGYRGKLNLGSDADVLEIPPAAESNTFYATWDKGKATHLSDFIASPHSWTYTAHMETGGEQLVIGGFYYDAMHDLALQSPDGRQFPLSSNEYGTCAFIAGGAIAPVENETTDSLLIDPMADLLESMACLGPDYLERPDVWLPLMQDSLAISELSTEANGCGYLIESLSARLYPNPVVDIMTLELTGFDGRVQIDIYSATSGLVFSHSTILDPGVATLSFDVSNLERATYFVSITQGGLRKVLQMVRQ